MAQTQISLVPKDHGRDEEGRSQDVAGLAADIWGMNPDESDGADRGSVELSDITGAGDPGDVAAINFLGRA